MCSAGSDGESVGNRGQHGNHGNDKSASWKRHAGQAQGGIRLSPVGSGSDAGSDCDHHMDFRMAACGEIKQAFSS